MTNANADVRQRAKEAGVYLYQIARELKVSEPTMTRLLRYELPEKKKAKINGIIDRLAQSVKEGESV